MDGIHDLGGREGFGQVEREADEPAFHGRWEAAVFAMTRAGSRAGAWNNTDRFRHAIERIAPAAYLTHTYYGRWLGGIETLLVEAGLIDSAEVTRRAQASGAAQNDLIAARPASDPDPLSEVETLPTAARSVSYPPAFSAGDRVRTLTNGVPGHTRLPGYARGREGTVTTCHGGWVYPDTNAHGLGEVPRHLYTVRFEGRELWGEDAEANLAVHLDLFEPYLEPAGVHL